MLAGHGHGSSLSVTLWLPEADGVRCHYFMVRGGAGHSGFPDDNWDVVHWTFVETLPRYFELVAGMRTILEARLTPWLGSPSSYGWSSDSDFAISIQGLDAPAPTGFCKYEVPQERVACEGWRAAWAWHDRFLPQFRYFASEPISPATKRQFSEQFRRGLPQWSGWSWWWVCEHMLGLAAVCGDDTLRQPLADMLLQDLGDGQKRVCRYTAGAANALAAITGVDLRFAKDGSARPLADVAADFLQLLAR